MSQGRSIPGERLKLTQKLNFRTTYLLMEALLFLGFSYLFIFSSTNANFINLDILKTSAVLVSIIGMIWFIVGKRTVIPLFWPWLVWILLYVVNVTLSVDPRRSVSQLVLMAVAIFIFALLTDLVGRGWPAELVIKCLLLAGSLVVLIGWLDVINWYRRWLEAAPGQWLPSIIYRPGSANVIAMFMNLLIVLALARLMSLKTMPGRILLVILIIASGGLLFLTSSRGGWLSLAVGIACLALLGSRFRHFDIRPIWRSIRHRPMIFVLFGLFSTVIFLVGGYLMYRQMIHPTHSWSFAVRRDLWLPAWQVFLKYPLLGSGAFTYSNAFMGQNSIPPLELYIHPHSMFFSILSERGILGIICAGWLVVSLGFALRNRLYEVKPEDLAVVIGASSALAALLFHSLFDSFHTEPIAFWGCLTALGAALGGSQAYRSHPAHWWQSRPWGTMLLIMGLWGGIWLQAPLFQGVDQANSNQISQAVTSFESAVQRDHQSVISYQQYGLANSILAERGDPQALGKAVQAFQETVRRNPEYAFNHANLGALYLNQGNLEGAQKEFQESINRAPSCMVCYLNLGVVFEANGNTTEASQAYQVVLKNRPDWADTYFWRSSSVRSAAFQSWKNNQQVQQPASLEQLEQNLEANPELVSSYIALAAARLQKGENEKAGKLLTLAELAYSSSPSDHLELLWEEAEIKANLGDLEGAIILGKQALQGYQLQGVNGPGSFGNLAYASLAFRQPAMAAELVPQMQLIGLPDFWGERFHQLIQWYKQTGNNEKAQEILQILEQEIPDFGID
jgi:tetratricopeptide (TPR) repeat protein